MTSGRSATPKESQYGSQAPRILESPEYEYTDGTDCGYMAKSYGLTPDLWQQLVLDVWLACDMLGKYICSTCGLSVPRQNGKNGILEMIELFKLVVLGRKILHTAHEVKTCRKAFVRLMGFFTNEKEYPELSEMVVQIRQTNGQEAIILKNGGSIEFISRSKSSGRGFSVDDLVCDEAQELTDDQLQAVLSTISASPSGCPQFFLTGTPPGPGSPGTVFRRTRESAIKKTGERLAWLEWSVEDIGDVSDKSRWNDANPAIGYRISNDVIKAELVNLSEDGFARERLGWWSSSGQLFAIREEKWNRLSTKNPPKTEESKVAFGVKFSPDGLFVSLAVALKPEDGSTPYVEIIDYKSMIGGVTWIAEKLAGYRSIASLVVIDGRSNTDTLAAVLADVGFQGSAVYVARSADVVSASTRFLNAITEGKLHHFAQSSLDDAIASTVKRPIGNDGGFGWGGSGGKDVSQVEAVSLAYWGVMTTRRNQRREVVLF